MAPTISRFITATLLGQILARFLRHLPSHEDPKGTKKHEANLLGFRVLRAFVAILLLIRSGCRRRWSQTGRQWKIAVVRRPVRHRLIGWRIEHRRVNEMDLRVVDEEPLAEHV